MRRTLIITAIVVLLLGASIAAYFYASSGTATVAVAPAGSASLPVAGQTAPGTISTANTEPSLAPGAPSAPVSVSARLVQISTGPIVPGESVVDTKAADASSSPEVTVNYIERASGNVFSYASPSGTLTRINNRTIPGIQSAAWLPDGMTAYVRYLSGSDFSTINTYALSAASSTGFFLPQDLADVSVSAAGLLTLASGGNGSAVSLSRTDGTRSTTLFTTPLSSIRTSFAGKNQYLVFSKPAASLAGDAFLVDSAGRFSRIAGPLNGLVALPSPSGKWVLVSYTQNGAMQMELINTATDTTLPLPLATIADKCVWAADDSSIYCGIPMSPSANYAYPDDWYQGAAHFSDRIWKIDVAGRYEQLVLDFSQANKGDLDAEALALDPAKSLLVFINKNDGSLWSYSL